MASKARRNVSNTPTPTPSIPTGTSTPQQTQQQQQQQTNQNAGSPLSPTRHSRLHEKAELQNLNDRLACYIDRVRFLEQENSRLTMEVRTSQETVTREISNIKGMYENELADARRLLDDTSKEKAKLEIDTKRFWEENEDLRKRLDKKTKEFAAADSNHRIFEGRYIEISAKYNTLQSERKKLAEDLKDSEKDNLKLKKQLEELRKNLEEETLARVDLENNIQSLREEITFKDQVFQQELTETRSRRQVEISEIDGRLHEQYEAKLQQSLQGLRDQYEAQMRANRDEIADLYDSKIRNLNDAAARSQQSASKSEGELRETRIQLDLLNSKINSFDAQTAGLHSRIRDLESQLSFERERHNDEKAKLENELIRLRDEITSQVKDYQDLMDIKVSLDMEIAAYDKLLSGEENRLNITPGTLHSTLSQSSTSFRSGRQTPSMRTPSRAGNKRKRTTLLDESMEHNLSNYSVSSTSKCDIDIKEIDYDHGKYVKLYNKGDKEVQIGGWQLLRKSGVNETTFKFHRSIKIEAKSFITIWSSDCEGAVHEPPANIVMKTQKWFTGENVKTTLLNSEGVEMAESSRVKNVSSSRVSRHREVLGYGGEDIYHQQVRPGSRASAGAPEGGEKCRLM